MLKMIPHDDFADPAQRLMDRRQLRQDVDTIGILFDQAPQAANLAFDPAQATQDILFLLVLYSHCSLLMDRGYPYRVYVARWVQVPSVFYSKRAGRECL